MRRRQLFVRYVIRNRAFGFDSSMGIFILTTHGPVRIQRVMPEEQGIRSAVCVDGRAQALPISADYDAFVRRPTGVIERLVGHGSFRLDVAGAIDAGVSWQLPVLLAHLATDLETDVHVFATGEVDQDLGIRSVNDISAKIEALDAFVARESIPRDKSIILLPPESGEGAATGIGIRAYMPRTIREAAEIAGLPAPSTSNAMQPTHSVPKKRQRTWMYGYLAVGVATLFVLGAWAKDIIEWHRIAVSGQLLMLEQKMNTAERSVLRWPQSKLYRVWLQSRRLEAKDIEIELSNADAVASCVGGATIAAAPEHTTPICSLVWRAVIAYPAYNVSGRASLWRGGLGSDRPATVRRGSGNYNERQWVVPVEADGAGAHAARLVVVAGRYEPRGAQPWYSALNSLPADSVGFRAAVDRLARLGYLVIHRDWHSP